MAARQRVDDLARRQREAAEHRRQFDEAKAQRAAARESLQQLELQFGQELDKLELAEVMELLQSRSAFAAESCRRDHEDPRRRSLTRTTLLRAFAEAAATN